MGKNWERIPQLMQSHNLWGLKGKNQSKDECKYIFFVRFSVQFYWTYTRTVDIHTKKDNLQQNENHNLKLTKM